MTGWMSEGIHGTEGQTRSGDDAGGTVERDTSRDQSGDQAAWRDLVARLELPSAIDPADAPWPDRDNLAAAPTASQEASPHDTASQEASPHDTASQEASSRDANDPQSGTGQSAPADRSRVIRPASFMRFAEPAGAQPSPGAAEVPPGLDRDPLRGRAGGRHTDDGGLDEPTHPDLGFLDYDAIDDHDADERYVPPQLPPQPKLDPVARSAWTALFGGPGYLFVATTLAWQVPGWAGLAATIAFIAGFVILVSRLGDGPSRRDGPDQGAVV